MTDTVDCPYCEHENEVEDDGEGTFDYECSECQEEFEVTVEYYPTYSSAKIVYKNCIDCGKEYRFDGRSFPAPKKYEHISRDDYNVCNKCFKREYRKDWEDFTL